MIFLSKIEHRRETRIQVKFEKHHTLISKIKSIKGRRWSKTKRCWHLPYSKLYFEQLKMVFGEENLKYNSKENLAETKNISEPPSKLKVQYVEYQSGDEIRKKVIGEKIIIHQKNAHWLSVYIPFDKKGWREAIRNIRGRKWNVKKASWEIPNVKQNYWQMKKHIGLENIQFDFKIKKEILEEYVSPTYDYPQKKVVKVKRYETLNTQQKIAIQKTAEQIILNRLSPTTLKLYKSHLIAIFYFYKKIAPEELTNKHIQDYMLYQIKHKKISESTQHTIINAIKAYWEKVLKRPKSWIDLPNPKRPKKLPNVLSTEDIIKLVTAPSNLKHQLILLLIYSAGLRKGEVRLLLTKDINISRRAIHIKGGKGKKDRYVVLAETVIPYLKTYKKRYRPNRWLFEGQTGGMYSASSLQKIFNRALAKSKVDSKQRKKWEESLQLFLLAIILGEVCLYLEFQR